MQTAVTFRSRLHTGLADLNLRNARRLTLQGLDINYASIFRLLKIQLIINDIFIFLIGVLCFFFIFADI